jgi:putative phage-type endonuclease
MIAPSVNRVVTHELMQATNAGKPVPCALRVMEWSKEWPQPTQKSEAWKKQRADYCTASQHASALGRCQYKSRTDCLRQYGGIIESTFTGNAATRHGEKHEDTAVAKYAAARGVEVMFFGMLPFFEQSEWLGGSPDGITTDGVLIEVKCPYMRRPNGVVPPHYLPQVQSMMHGLDLKMCHFIEYVPGNSWAEEVFEVIEVPRDPLYWKTALPLLTSFWDEVLVLRSADVREFQMPPTKRKRKPKAIAPAPCVIQVGGPPR